MTGERFIDLLVNNNTMILMYEIHILEMNDRGENIMDLPSFIQFWQNQVSRKVSLRVQHNFDLDEFVTFYVKKYMNKLNIMKVVSKDRVFLFHSHIN